MELERYSIINNKNSREIVLLKAFPCEWGRCSFCDYIEDNSTKEKEMVDLNKKVLSQVTGKYKVLEVINSGSCFELPKETLRDIKQVIKEKAIDKLYFESHWMYRNRLKEMEEYFGIPIIFKCGIETFDNNFRNKILKKGIIFQNPEDVARYFKSICLMVGIYGQTKESIDKDIEYLLKYFEKGCINMYIENSTSLKRDENLIKWFCEKYAYLESNDNIEILWNNTDFGVGGEANV
ncbi:radical SAM protein [Clostridium grantii]|uniref:Elp3/MiaA/NifB-like radical SAM core domain-containing protein n=1 Tax=Clostridium grantii DSM 8605 TaxID=1121316 RepID=A0A1M5RTM1_9CLOT|nr:radical SAM protein [Clostridium grantii]SHH29584.1 hypothetical protein SAMN02745207_00714 [Clostridium grantii DSM 8605]